MIGTTPRRHALSACALALVTVVLAGAAPTPGGCGSSVTESREYTGIYQCDTIVNGVPSCVGNTDCGEGEGRCPCMHENGSRYCGRCLSDTVLPCKYCQPQYDCPANPCSGQCITPPDLCPAGAPIDCGNGSCCPTDYPACCADQAWCGKSLTGCPTKSPDDHPGDGPGCGAPPGGCGSMGYGFFSASAGDGCCASAGCVDACADDCGTSWYEVDGRLFGPCDVSDAGYQSCLNDAVAAANAACR